MPSIDPYINRGEAKRFLASIPWINSESIAQSKWNADHSTYGVGANTFRAFTGYQNKPSVQYRAWARNQSKSLSGEALLKATSSRQDFDAWHQELAQSLRRTWQRTQSKPLSVPHKYKLVDLYVKWLTRHAFTPPSVTEGLLNHAHCALDSRILNTINKCLSSALPLNAASMGHIATEEIYAFCQQVIREYCLAIGGTPILFDYYAWPLRPKLGPAKD